MPPLVLASSSPYRRQLLDRLQLPYTAASPHIDETAQPGELPAELAQRLATAKARALASRYPRSLIIGSDQVASRDGKIIGKPGDFQRARQQLLDASGQSVVFYTGLSLINTATGEVHEHLATFNVEFHPLSAEQIDGYLHAERPYDCAGSFKCEGLGIALFKRLWGDDSTSLVGLPLLALCELLRREGIDPLTAATKETASTTPPS